MSVGNIAMWSYCSLAEAETMSLPFEEQIVVNNGFLHYHRTTNEAP